MAATARMQNVIRFLRHANDGACRSQTDAELLQRFVTERDEAAFELLVWRHGGMVMGTCQRLLRHGHDAEDAFQATFLTLVRKAGSIGKRSSVASWLYKVAYHTALRARKHNARQPEPVNGALDGMAGPDLFAFDDSDLRSVLDAEIQRLPAHYRLPVILCYLEGKTHSQAAHELACPRGTIGVRLARARERLRVRLVRRGIMLAAGAVGMALAGEANAATVTPLVVHATLQTIMATFAGEGMPSIVALSQGVIHAMFMTRLKIAAAVLLTLGFVGMGTGAVAYQAFASDPDGNAALALQDGQKRGKDAAGPDRENALRQENKALKERIEKLLYDLSLREAQAAQAQDRMHALQQQVDRSNDAKAARLDKESAGLALRLADRRKQLANELPILQLLLERQPERIDLAQIEHATATLNAFRDALTDYQKHPITGADAGGGSKLANAVANCTQCHLADVHVPDQAQRCKSLALLQRHSHPGTDAGDVHVINDRSFLLPIQLKEADKETVQELVLYVSGDAGQTWKEAGTAKPHQWYFRYQAPANGEYWFSVVVHRRDGLARALLDGSSKADAKELVPLVKVRVQADDAQPGANRADLNQLQAPNVKPLPTGGTTGLSILSMPSIPTTIADNELPTVCLDVGDDGKQLGNVVLQLPGKQQAIVITGRGGNALAELSAYLRDYRRRSKLTSPRINLAVDSRVAYDDVVKVINACEAVDFRTVKLSTQPLEEFLEPTTAENELKKWAGEWEIVLMEQDGMKQVPSERKRLRIVGDQIVGSEEGSTAKPITLCLGTLGANKTVEFRAPDKALVRHGIYQLDRDVLVLCLADAQAPLPTDLKTTEGSGRRLLVFRKIP